MVRPDFEQTPDGLTSAIDYALFELREILVRILLPMEMLRLSKRRRELLNAEQWDSMQQGLMDNLQWASQFAEYATDLIAQSHDILRGQSDESLAEAIRLLEEVVNKIPDLESCTQPLIASTVYLHVTDFIDVIDKIEQTITVMRDTQDAVRRSLFSGDQDTQL